MGAIGGNNESPKCLFVWKKKIDLHPEKEVSFPMCDNTENL